MENEFILLKDIAFNLNPLSWKILELFNEKEYLTYSDVKNEIKKSQEKLSKEIARLQGALLIDFKKNSEDERTKPLIITLNGKKILNLKKGDICK